jgi:hypothetical protein
LVVPLGNEFSAAMKAFEGAGKVIKFAGKGFKTPTAAEEAAANAAKESKEALAFADKATKKGDVGPVEKYAKIVADSISKGGQKLEQALEAVPEFYRPMVKSYLPLASLELGGAGVGAISDPEDRFRGVLKGMGLASTLYAPRVVADLAKARRTLAGAPGDMFSVAMATPESSLATKAVSYLPSRKLPFLNESVINWTANNIKDFIRTGAETVPLGIALGVYNDQDAEGVGETLANGAIFAYSHGAITKATGKSPYEAQRYRKQKDYENFKLLNRLPEGDRARLSAAASWDEVISASKAKLDESTKNYQELYSKNPEAPETIKAADEVTKDKGIYEMNQRASVATRQEYTRQVVGVLSSVDRRINGPMSPGRNFNIRLMGKDEIAQKLMDVNPGMDKATAEFFANNAGARYAASGQVKLPGGQAVGPRAEGVLFDPMRDTAVINMDKIREKQAVTGRPLAWVLTHEADHIAQGFKEYRDVTNPLREKLFGKKVFLPDGSVVPGSEGVYSTEMLNDMFLNNYLKSSTTREQKEQFAKNNNLWDYQKQTYDPIKVASYMQEEILAEANAAGLGANQVGGKGMARLDNPIQNIIDWALVSNENNRLARVIKKGSFSGVKDPFTSALTGAQFTPEMLAHVRRNNIALNELNGVLTPHDGSDIAPEIKPNDIKNNRALAEEFTKDDGKFKTTKIGEVVDADGNVVYRHLITNPEAAEGEWKASDDAERQPVRVKGYGQMPEELTTQIIPEGGSMRVVSQIVYDEKGKPVERDKNAYKALIQTRSQLIRDAILKHDQNNPAAMRPFTADNLSFRGKLTQNQLNEILNLPESIVPLSIKEKIALARDIIDSGDGTPTIGMYASRLSSTGKYKPFSPKIVQSKPISLSFSKDGHFLVNEFNVTGARDKANLILKYQPEILKMWNYDPNEFLKGLSTYMKNWQNDPAEMDPLSEQAAQTRHRNLDGDFNKAMQMRYVYDAFLNVAPPKDELRPKNFNPVVITLPKIKRSQMTKDEKADFRSSDPMSLIRSRRLDAYSHYERSNGQKYPFEYGKSIFNAMPEAQIDPEAALEMKPAKPSREAAPTISSPILRGINAIQGKDSGQMGSAFATSGEKQSFGAQFSPEYAQKYPTSETGFYSQLQKTIDEKMPNKGSVAQLMAIVDPAKGSGVKPDEIKWSNLEGFLEGKDSVTKQEVLNYLKNEGQVKFEDVTLNETGKLDAKSAISELPAQDIQDYIGVWREESDPPTQDFDDKVKKASGNKEELMKLANQYASHLGQPIEDFFMTDQDGSEVQTVGFSQYGEKGRNLVIPNGQNYREVVMTIPSASGERKYAKSDIQLKRNGNSWSFSTSDGVVSGSIPGTGHSESDALGYALQMAQSTSSPMAKPTGEKSEYTSSHFPDIPNYVAHMRLNERSDADGDGLFIEELQSDRHQKGRRHGYKGESKEMEDALAKAGLTMKSDGWNTAAIDKDGYEVVPDASNMSGERPIGSKGFRQATPEESAALNEARKFSVGTIPDAPFRKDWNVQLFKRALRDALDGEKDWIGWTNGETQAERYNLSKKVKDLYATPKQDGTYDLSYTPKDGRTGISRPLAENVPQDKLADYVGKELAEKISQQDSSRVYSSPDLKVGGEGMKGFYDDILPKEVGKYVKKFGAKVEQSEIISGERYADPLHDIPQEAQDRIFNQVEKQLEREGIFEDDENVDRDEYRDLFMERQRDLSEEWARVHSKGTKTHKIWKVKITPEMRKTILEKGQPQAMTTQQQNTQIA